MLLLVLGSKLQVDIDIHMCLITEILLLIKVYV